MTVGTSKERSNSGRTWRLATKELREILRDRRTVLTLVLMPLLVYPLLGVVMRNGIISNLTLQQAEVRIYCESVDQLQAFQFEMASGRTILGEDRKSGTPEGLEAAVQDMVSRSHEVTFRLLEPTTEVSVEQALTSGEADLGLRISPVPQPQGTGLRTQDFRRWEILRREDSPVGARGYKEVVRRLEAVNENYTSRLLAKHGLSELQPQTIAEEVIEADESEPPILLTFIPLVLVLMTMTGAVYPAIDLTAGERERGTLEILVAAPVSRMTLLGGKFMAVLVVALLTATMNLISMFVTLFALGLEGTVLGNIGPVVMGQVCVLMVVFAAFFSAVLLSVTSVARSFKEAQAYLVPLMLISLTPGILSLLPDMHMTSLLAVVPLVNTVLMARDLLMGDVSVVLFAVVLISTALYGVLALSLAARIFGSDAVMYGSSGSWKQLLQRPQDQSSVAPLPVGIGCVAAVFVLFILVGSLPTRLDLSMSGILLINVVVFGLLFVVLPVGTATAARVKVGSGFALHLPGPGSCCAAALLGLSLWPFLYEINVMTLSQARIDKLTELFAKLDVGLGSVPLWIKLLSLAVAPAVCEEFFFRGFLQSSLRNVTSAPVAIFSAGILFGVFHLFTSQGLMVERLLASSLMGIVIGYVFEKSGSVVPGMILHLLHNGLLNSIAHYEKQLSRFAIHLDNQQHMPAELLVTAAVLATVGFVMLWSQRRRTAGMADPA